MKNFLQGRWLGHPLHPALAHLPVSLWLTAFIADWLSQWGAGNNVFVQISFYAIALGLVSIFLTVPTGLAEWWDIKPTHPAWRLSLWHLGLNLMAAVLWLINLGLRVMTYQTATSVSLLPLLLSTWATGVLLVAGYLGGRMVYDQGMGVARTAKKWQRLAKLGGSLSAQPQEKNA